MIPPTVCVPSHESERCPRCGTVPVSLPLAGADESYYCDSCDRSFS